MIPVLFVSLLISMSSYRQAKQTANTLTENAISAQVKRVDLNLNTRTKLIEISLQSLVDIVSTEYENVKNSDDFEQKMKLYMGNMAAPFSEILWFCFVKTISTSNRINPYLLHANKTDKHVTNNDICIKYKRNKSKVSYQDYIT